MVKDGFGSQFQRDTVYQNREDMAAGREGTDMTKKLAGHIASALRK